ncbi:MAG: serine/threonine protein kinase, partial [Planctomycetota bacterium]
MEKYILPTGTDGFASTYIPSENRGFFPNLSDFQILEDIAQGGMGIVYKVFDRKEKRISALKVLNLAVLLPEEREEEIARFQREARLAMEIEHPALVKAYRAGCENGIWYYAMEYIPGEDLGEIIDRQGTMEVEEVIPIMITIAKALQYIEEKGMVHRDLKPDNILIGYDGTVKLCDYGLLRRKKVSTAITSAGISIGTPNYMSPEQAKGDVELDIRSDIYSLGMTLYHLLTGKTPFESTSVTLTLSRHIFEKVPSIRKYNPEIHPDLEGIIAKMTEKKPSKRFQSAKDLVEALENFFSCHLQKKEPTHKKNNNSSEQKQLQFHFDAEQLQLPFFHHQRKTKAF